MGLGDVLSYRNSPSLSNKGCLQFWGSEPPSKAKMYTCLRTVGYRHAYSGFRLMAFHLIDAHRLCKLMQS